MNSQEIIGYVMSCNNEEELAALNSLLVSRLKNLHANKDYEAIRQLRVGDRVSFDRGPRRGGMCTGTIKSLGGKNVKLDVGGMQWRVNAGSLTKV